MTKLRSGAALVMLVLFPVLVLAVVAAIGWGVYQAGQVEHSWGRLVAQLVLVPLVLAVGGAVLTVWRARPTPTPGPELTRADHPRFFALLDDVAAQVGTPSPTRVVVIPDANAAVTRVGDVDELLVGLPVLALTSVDELRALLAHELAHVAGGDTAASARTVRWSGFLELVHETSGLLKPLFAAYRALYDAAAGLSSRDLEEAADAASVRVAGAAATASLMKTMPFAEAAWARFGERFLPVFHAASGRAPIVVGLQRLADAARTQLEAEAADALASERRSFRDSHPLTRDRMAALVAMDAGSAVDRRPSSELFDADAVTEAEGGLFVHRWTLTTWEDVLARGVLPALKAGAAEVVDGFLQDGVAEKPTIGDTLAQCDPQWTAMSRELAKEATKEGLGDGAAANGYWSLLRSLAGGALAAVPGATARLSWAGDATVTLPDGRDVAVEELFAGAAAGSVANGLRTRLVELGAPIDEPLSASELAATTVAELTDVFAQAHGRDRQRAHIAAYTTGLLVVPAKRWVAPLADQQTAAGEPLPDYLDRPLDELRNDPANRWIDFEQVESLKVRILPTSKLVVTLRDGESLSWTVSDQLRMQVGAPLEEVWEGISNRRLALG